MSSNSEFSSFINELAWRDFVSFSIENDNIRKQFQDETKFVLPNKKDKLIDQMVIEACNGMSNNEVLKEFVTWVTITQWGISSAPAGLKNEWKKNKIDPKQLLEKYGYKTKGKNNEKSNTR